MSDERWRSPCFRLVVSWWFSQVIWTGTFFFVRLRVIRKFQCSFNTDFSFYFQFEGLNRWTGGKWLISQFYVTASKINNSIDEVFRSIVTEVDFGPFQATKISSFFLCIRTGLLFIIFTLYSCFTEMKFSSKRTVPFHLVFIDKDPVSTVLSLSVSSTIRRDAPDHLSQTVYSVVRQIKSIITR